MRDRTRIIVPACDDRVARFGKNFPSAEEGIAVACDVWLRMGLQTGAAIARGTTLWHAAAPDGKFFQDEQTNHNIKSYPPPPPVKS